MGNATSRKAIDNIGSQIERLMNEHDKVVGQRDELDKECRALHEENRRLKEQMKNLETELASAQVSGGLAGDENYRKKARACINRLLREVDRCIAIAENETVNSEGILKQ